MSSDVIITSVGLYALGAFLEFLVYMGVWSAIKYPMGADDVEKREIKESATKKRS